MSAVNLRGLSSKLKRVSDVKDTVMPQAYQYFRAITPKRSGNAKNRTRLNNNKDIEAAYNYASYLDEGSSRQAPKGMTEPTVTKLQKLVTDYIKKIGAANG